jgi:hypothetical protein
MEKILLVVFIFLFSLFGNESLDFHQKSFSVEYSENELESDDEKFIKIEKLNFKVDNFFNFFSNKYIFRFKPFKPYKPPAKIS